MKKLLNDTFPLQSYRSVPWSPLFFGGNCKIIKVGNLVSGVGNLLLFSIN